MNFDYLDISLAFGNKTGNFDTFPSLEIPVNSILSYIQKFTCRSVVYWCVLCTIVPFSILLSNNNPKDPFLYYPALLDTLLSGHYDAAETLCDLIYDDLGEHPAYYYARSTTLYTRFFDLEDTTGRAQFYTLVDSSLNSCDQWLKQATSDFERADIYYLRGSALSIKGLTYRQDGHTLSMIRLLMESHSSFDRAIKLIPDFYDAYLGRGAYRFGVAREASLLKWLPFMPSKQSGLDDMWKAVRNSRFSVYPALSALVWFALEEHDFSLADSICTVGLERFPNARSFLWPKLSLQKKQCDYAAAAVTAQLLLDQYLALEDGNGYDATGLLATLSECADALGNPELAVEYARRGIEIKRSPYAEQRRAKTLEALRKRIAQSN